MCRVASLVYKSVKFGKIKQNMYTCILRGVKVCVCDKGSIKRD